MLETVRVHVDQDTADILERITQGITDQLSETPYWTDAFSRDLKEHLAGIVTLRPDWVSQEKEKLCQRLQEHFDHLETVVCDVQAAEQVHLKTLDEHIRNFNADTQQRLTELETRFQQLSTNVSTSVSAIQTQTVILSECQEQLAVLGRPWWKKLFGRVK